MVDAELQEKIKNKIEDESLEPSDIDDFMTLFCQIANESQEVKDEIYKWGDKKLVFYLGEGNDLTLFVTDEVFSFKKTVVEDWDSTIKLSPENFVLLLAGQKDGQGLYMGGDLEAHGGLPNILKFQTIAQVIQETIGV